MPEEQAFSVLVKIMFDYGLRELFKQNFEDLHCKFYQLERLMQVGVQTGVTWMDQSLQFKTSSLSYAWIVFATSWWGWRVRTIHIGGFLRIESVDSRPAWCRWQCAVSWKAAVPDQVERLSWPGVAVTSELAAGTPQRGFAVSAHPLPGFPAKVRARRLHSLCMWHSVLLSIHPAVSLRRP